MKTVYSYSFCKYLFLFFSLGLLAGCAATKPAESFAISSPVYWNAPDRVSALLIYFDQLRLLSSVELARETERARKSYAKDKSTFYQLQYALTLSVPGGDNRHAQQLLEPLIKEAGQSERALHALAAMVYTGLAERQRLESALQIQTRRADDLESKLEALKEIEKKMMQRERVIKEKP